MSYLIVSLLLSMTLNATEGLAGPGSPIVGSGTTICEAHLLESIAPDLKRLKLSEEILERAEGNDRRFLTALVRVLARLDERLLSRVAQSVIEDPDPIPKDELLRNPFFTQFPDQYRPFAATTLATLRDQFSDRFDEYELGLLAALIPDSGRVDERSEIAPTVDETSDRDLSKQVQYLHDVMHSDDYRKALQQVLAPLADDLLFLLECAQMVGTIDPSVVRNRFDPDFVWKTLDRMARGPVNKSDLTVITTMIMNLYGRMSKWARTMDTPRVRGTFRFDGSVHNILYREWSQKYAERYITEILRRDTNVAAMTLAFAAVTAYDPIPTTGKGLRQSLVTRAEPLVQPVVRRLRPAESKPFAGVLVDAAVPKQKAKYEPKDMFAPQPAGKKRAREAVASAASVSPATAVRPAPIASEVDLHAFTSFVANPRSLDKLDPGVTYQFHYMRANDLIVYYARFGVEVIEWLKANQAPGRQILTALNLGDYRGQMTGIKPRGKLSRRFEGTIYEVKNRGNFSALMVFDGGVWHIVRISHKDDVHRDLEWIGPLT